MLRQTIQGLRSKSVTFQEESSETAIASLMAGKIEVFKSASTGGSELSQAPNVLNRKQFIVSKETSTGRLSAMVKIPHVKESFGFSDIVTNAKGKFDADYEHDEKCDAVKLNFDKLA